MFKKTRRRVRTRFGIDLLIESTKFIVALLKRLLRIKEKPDHIPEEQQTLDHLNIPSDELLQRQKFLLKLCGFYGVIFLLLFIYSLYLLISHGDYKAFFIGLSASIAALSVSFRYHFWYIQTKYNKLGMSFQEWFEKATGKKPTKT